MEPRANAGSRVLWLLLIAGRILSGPTPGGRGRGLEVGTFEYNFSEWSSFSVPPFDDEEVFQLNFVTEVREYGPPGQTG